MQAFKQNIAQNLKIIEKFSRSPTQANKKEDRDFILFIKIIYLNFRLIINFTLNPHSHIL